MLKATVSLPRSRAWSGAREKLPTFSPSHFIGYGRTTPPELPRHVKVTPIAWENWNPDPLRVDAPPSPMISEPPAEALEGLESRFRRLAEIWHDETDVFSSPTTVFMHPAYQTIIGMGPAVLPLLLADLRDTKAHWFWALRTITGEDPIPSDAAGDVDRMVDAWLMWGRSRGIL